MPPEEVTRPGPHALRLGDVQRIPRLKRLREDILGSEYHLCTQKASLLTAYFKQDDRSPHWLRALSSLHFRLFGRSLERTQQEIPQKRWQTLLNNRLNALYLKQLERTRARSVIEYARALSYILSHMPLKVYDHELVVGNPSAFRVGAPIHPDLGGLMMLPELQGLSTRTNNPIRTEPDQIKELEEEIFPFWFHRSVMARATLYSNNPDLFNILLQGCYYILTQFSGISHVTPDYPTVLEKGFRGIESSILERMSEVKDRLEEARSGQGSGAGGRETIQGLEEKLAFYEAGKIVTGAAVEYGARWSRHLKDLAAREEDVGRREELMELSGIFEQVPAAPATSFHEAVQSVLTTHVILHQESFQHGVSFGRMDQYLLPFYRKDVEAGRLTPERAVEILGCFLGKAGELLPLFFDRATEYFSGLSSASGITLGGQKADGSDGVNELSYLILLAYDQVRLRQPNLHVRQSDGAPRAFRDLCREVLSKGGGLPAFFNDRTIVPALQRVGMTDRDAKEYAVVGCVEWGCPGKSFPAAGAVFVNLPMALHLALHNGCFNGSRFGPATGLPEDFPTMEELLQAFRKQLEHLLHLAVEGNNAIEKTHALHRPTPLLSCVVQGCIEKGIEVNAGGAVYNSTGCQGVGLADAIDSFTAIEQLVFKEKKISMKDLVAAVDRNFSGHDELRSTLLRRVPKFGTDSGLADAHANVLSRLFAETVVSFKNPRNGTYLPGFWSMTTHQGFGKRMPALPSGRVAGESLANGISPCDGRDRLGPTASLASASCLDHRLLTNGYALNQKLDLESLKGPQGKAILDGIIAGYFEKGGMQVQFNVVDPQILKDARAHPENHQDLVVRVSGYSAYFNDLTDAVKVELIQRTLHSPSCEG